jgi:hypothetical protein
MSRYHLSEAYSNLYNPRLQENFDDNLQFIDYMLDEDIEEVVESLFWEFRDYGNTIDEAIDLLRECASTEVITESMEVLAEARFSARQMQDRKTFKATQNKERDANVRKETRKARVDGAISRVKQAWKGATGGMAKASKALSGGATKASEYVNAKRKEGQSRLQNLLRTGATKVSKGAQRVGRAYTAAKNELTGQTADNKRQQYNDKKTTSSAANRATQSNAFKTPVRPTIGKVKPGPASRSQRSVERPAPTPTPKPTSSERKYPVDPNSSNGQFTMFTGKGPKGKSTGIPVKVPAGGQKSFGAKRKPKPTSKTRQVPLNLRKAGYAEVNESFEQQLVSRIIQDMIDEAYANNVEEALEILDSLDENTFDTIVQDYLND